MYYNNGAYFLLIGDGRTTKAAAKTGRLNGCCGYGSAGILIITKTSSKNSVLLKIILFLRQGTIL